MITHKITTKTSLRVNNSTKGESLETKLERIMKNKEPIKDQAPLIYTERKEGIKAAHNIRTDRFEVAVDAATKIAKSYKAKREERQKQGADGSQEDGKPESIHGKDKPTGGDPKNP